MKKELLNRILLVLLAVVLCTGMLGSAFAEGEQPSAVSVGVLEEERHLSPGDVRELIRPTNPNGSEVFAAWYVGTDEERAKVQELADQCRQEGVTADLGIALWMHDWLVYNANYDYTFTEYYPEGVLLKGTGVCQSYALAYEMLMKEMGIDCVTLISGEMNHAWNLVKLDGVWCHVDCTWDDPNEGGYECYDYFGLNDTLMGRDHQWNQSSYESCTSLAYFYFKLAGGCAVSSKEELFEELNRKAEAKETNFHCMYIGEDPEFVIIECFQQWLDENAYGYCIGGYGGSYSQYSMDMTVSYYSQSGEAAASIQAPSFALEGLNGIYRSESYDSNGVLLVCGANGNPNTTALMDQLYSELDTLYAGGVEVLVSLSGIEQPADLRDLQTQYPNMHLTCGSSQLREAILWAIGIEASSYFPVVAVVDDNSCITYYHTDFLDNAAEVINAAKAAATGNPLPAPVPISCEGDADVDLETISGSTVVSELNQLSRQHNGLVFLYSDTCGEAETQQMDAWESNIRLMNALDIRMAVCIGAFDGSARNQYVDAYPDIVFLADDNAVYTAMLTAVDGFAADGVYLSNYLIDGQGTITRYSCCGVLDLTMCAGRVAREIPCDVVMPADLTEIRQEAFQAAGLQGVDLTGSGITTIGARAFADNGELVVVIIPDSVTQIAEDAFDGCDNLVILAGADSTAYQYARARGILVLAS